MNIFVLDRDVRTAAQFHCDRHICKMILKSAQMLCTAHHLLGDKTTNIPYRQTHVNHPCSQWIRESVAHYLWLCDLAYWLNEEFRLRWNHKDNHASYEIIRNLPHFSTLRFPVTEEKSREIVFAVCMPDQYKVKRPDGTLDEVESYRNYYRGAKRDFATWTFRNVPEWY